MSATTATKSNAPTVSTRRKSIIAIRPYFDEEVNNMGLEKYQMSLYDGVSHYEQLACIEKHGIKRYITGLDESAPDVKLLPAEDREAKVKFIRETVSRLERELATNDIDPQDPDFWNKVQLLKPNNSAFWDQVYISAGNDPIYLNPDDPHDLIKILAIEAGGFSMISKNLEEARKRPVALKFYLDKHQESVSTRNETRKIKNEAIAALQTLMNRHKNKFMYVAKVIDPSSPQYNRSTPVEVLYENMDKYINGEANEKNIGRAANNFLAVADMDMETLKIKAMIKDATYYRYIANKSDGFLHYIDGDVKLGRNVSEVIEFFKNPANDQVLVDLMGRIEKEWDS